jgi:hypothetical protein
MFVGQYFNFRDLKQASDQGQRLIIRDNYNDPIARVRSY